jgi:hypothetical protein
MSRPLRALRELGVSFSGAEVPRKALHRGLDPDQLEDP